MNIGREGESCEVIEIMQILPRFARSDASHTRAAAIAQAGAIKGQSRVGVRGFPLLAAAAEFP
jgi:hypothetical protein